LQDALLFGDLLLTRKNDVRNCRGINACRAAHAVAASDIIRTRNNCSGGDAL
jgi:hypothetical protein